MNICKIPDCGKKVKGYGLCAKHYQRLKRNGHTNLILEYGGPRKKYPSEYKSWDSMRQRCLCKTNKNYFRYGGKGITICDRWQGVHGFVHFLEDMGPKPSYEKTRNGRAVYTLDRIDPKKGYSPENCRWADWVTQETNRTICSKTKGIYKTPQGTWRARFRGNGKELVKTFKTKEEAIQQRELWIKKDPH